MLLKSVLLWERFIRCSMQFPVLCTFSRYHAIVMCGYYETFMSRCKEIWEDLCRAHIGSDEKLLYGNFCYIFSAQLYFIWFAIFQSYGILCLLYEFIYQLHGIIFLLYGSWCHNFPALYSTFVGKPISHRNIVQLRVKLILHRITFQDNFV